MGLTATAIAASDSIERGAATPAEDATYAQDAIETRRALIGMVGESDGSGVVRGVHVYRGDIYAFRDNAAATEGLMWKAATEGWVQQSLGNRVDFTSGTSEMFDEETLTQGAVHATILRVVKQSGSWGSDAEGYLVLGPVSSGSFSTGAAITALGSVTLSGAEVANTISPGGRYEFENYNFFGSSITKRMYGVNGVSESFEWDGDTFVPIITGNVIDAPSHLVINEYHLQLAFQNGSLQNSGTGTPYVWAGGGAAEIGCGDDIVSLKKEVGGALIIGCENRLFALHGKNTAGAPWDLKTLSEESGAIEWTTQRIGATRFMADRGFMSVNAVQEFGDFNTSAYSQVIEPLVNAQKGLAISSIIVKNKGQMRTFFSDGTGIITTFKDKKLVGFTTLKYLNQSGGAVTANCTANGEDSSGAEILFFGSSDGYVYQMDKGTSFDGATVPATIVLSYNHLGSPSLDKQFKKIVIEAFGSEGTEVIYNTLIDYSSGRSPPGVTISKVLGLTGLYWDNVNWNQFSWASEDVTRIEGYISGVGRNIAIQLSSESTYTEPYILYGVTYNFIKRKLVR